MLGGGVRVLIGDWLPTSLFVLGISTTYECPARRLCNDEIVRAFIPVLRTGRASSNVTARRTCNLGLLHSIKQMGL